MRISRVRLQPYALPLRRPWQSAAGTTSARHGLLVELTDHEGRCGYGDSAPLPAAGTETLEACRRWLERQLPRINNLSPEQGLARLPSANGCPAARCGLETALLDLHARQRDIALANALNPNAAPRIPVNASLGSADDGFAGRAAAALEAGYSILKIKLGIHPQPYELNKLRNLVERMPSGCGLRLDANRAWDRPTCLRWLTALAELPVESLEEPLSRPTPELLRELQASAPFPLALDESIAEMGLAWVMANPPVRRLVLKPMVQGSLLACLDAARAAPELEWVITTCVESAAGTWACAQLAAALDSPWAQGLGTAEWLAEDLGSPPAIRDGQLTLPEVPGSGFHYDFPGREQP